jgi:hypothetical protein
MSDDRTDELGNTAMPGSRSDERHPETPAHTPGGAARKLRQEAGEGDGVLDTVKRAAQEVDRQVSGEYERREDEAAERAEKI